MNICLLTSSYFPKIGGLEMVVHNLATALSRIGHNIVVVTPYSRKNMLLTETPYKVVAFGFTGSTRLRLTSIIAVLTLIYVVKKFSIDVIHVHDIYAPGTWAYYFRYFIKNIPVIGTPHGEDIQRFPTLKYGRRLSPKNDKIIRRNVKSFTLLTSISQSVHSELTKILGNGSVIKNIPNGIWTSDFALNVERLKIRKRYGIQIDSTTLISIGRNVPIKGFEIGIRAVAKLVNSGRKIVYILVGRDMSPIVDKAKELGISDMIITPGELAFQDVASLYQVSDIYISTSYIESFGITTLEAMCSGLPCVATDVPGNRDIVSPEFGLLVPSGSVDALTDEIGSLVDDPSYRKGLGEKARVAGQSYDWLKIAASYVDAYEEAITTFSNQA